MHVLIVSTCGRHWSSIPSFDSLLVHSFVDSIVDSVHSIKSFIILLCFFQSSIHHFICPFIHSFFIHSFGSLIYSFIHWFIHWLIDPFIHSFIRPVILWFIHCLIPLIGSFAHSRQSFMIWLVSWILWLFRRSHVLIVCKVLFCVELNPTYVACIRLFTLNLTM